jgi:hypothetical protein
VCHSPAGEFTVHINRAIPVAVTIATGLIIRSSTSERRPKKISANRQADSRFCLSFKIIVTANTQLATRFQPAKKLEVGAVHVVTRGGAGQLSFGVGVSDPHGMSSVADHKVMTLDANIYRVPPQQRLPARSMVLVAGQTAFFHAVPVFFGPVFLQLVTPVTQVLINVLFSIIGPAMTQRTLSILPMWIGSALRGSARGSVQRIALSSDEAP